MNDAVPQKFMRPKPYAGRAGVSSRTVYHWVDLKILPAYKFQGVLLLDVEECDSIIRGMRRHEIKPLVKRNLKQRKEAGI